MASTRFTELVGCAVPVQQAPMGGVAAAPDLAAAVAEAGGHGMVAAAGLSARALTATLDEVARRTEGAYGVGFLVPFLDPETTPELLELATARCGLVDFFYGDPDPALVEAVHAGGAIASWQVGSVEEARAAVDAGCEVIVAQGVEAGGHVRGTLGLLPLLDGVLAAVDLPVVAAGGIGTARGVAAAMAAGADAVRVGTRFVASDEAGVAGAHPDYVEALIGADPEDTVLTEAFSVMWPDAPHRVLRSCVERAEAFEGEEVGETTSEGATVPVPRFAVFNPTRETTGEIGAMALYAGQSVGAVRRVQPAVEILRELAGPDRAPARRD